MNPGPLRFGLRHGDRVRLTATVRVSSPVAVGQTGRVVGFSEAEGLERIIVEWDDGVWQALRPGEDQWEVVDLHRF